MALDALIRFLFSDEGASAGVGKLNAKLNELKRSGPDARRGLAALETGMRGLAFQAINLGGPVGKLAESLLRFGGGSALMLGAAAGIGALVVAYRTMTSETRSNVAAQEDLIKKLEAISAHGQAAAARIKLSGIEAERADKSIGTWLGRTSSSFISDITGGRLGASDTEREEDRRRREAGVRSTTGVLGPVVEKETREKEEERRRALLERIEFRQAEAELRSTGLQMFREQQALAHQQAMAGLAPRGLAALSETGVQKAIDDLALRLTGTAKAIADLAPRGFGAAALRETGEASRLAGLPGLGAQLEAAEDRRARALEFTLQITRDMLSPQQQFIDGMNQARMALELGVPGALALADAERHLTAERDKAIKLRASGLNAELKQQQSEKLAQLAAGISLGTAVLGAATDRGGIGQVLSAGGALAATIKTLNPFIGVGLAGLGGLVSIFESQHREREANRARQHAELIGVLHEGPMRVSNTFQQGYGQGSNESMYAYDRAKRLGREARLP